MTGISRSSSAPHFSLHEKTVSENVHQLVSQYPHLLQKLDPEERALLNKGSEQYPSYYSQPEINNRQVSSWVISELDPENLQEIKNKLEATRIDIPSRAIPSPISRENISILIPAHGPETSAGRRPSPAMKIMLWVSFWGFVVGIFGMAFANYKKA